MKSYDFLVVGAGAAGAAVSWYLAKQGLRGACLERGDWEDYSSLGSTYPVWEHQRRTVHNPVYSLRDAAADYPVDDRESPIAAAGYNAVGGSTVLFSGHFPRFHREDFSPRASPFGLERWPVGYDELLPFYELNEQMMTVGGLVGDPYFPEIKSLGPPVYLGDAGSVLQKAFNRLGWHLWPSYAAILTANTAEGRVACSNLGPCNNGCPTRSKSSADEVYIKPAIDLGLDLFTKAAVSQVITKGRRAVGVRYHDSDGNEREVFAENVVLASSALGSPRILLNSVGPDGRNGLANSSGLVGKNLMMHPAGYVEGLFSDELDTHVGPQGAFLFSLEHRKVSEDVADFGYMMHFLRGTSPLAAAQTALSRRALKFGPQMVETFSRYYRKQLGVTIVVEDRATVGNQVRLDKKRKDRFGVPGVSLHYQIDQNSKRLLSHGVGKAKEALRTAGAREIFAHAPLRNVGWHTMGTVRMGTDPSNSVVAPTGESHDIKGLYVVDSSIFVTGSCVNPANTIQALALLLAQGIGDA